MKMPKSIETLRHDERKSMKDVRVEDWRKLSKTDESSLKKHLVSSKSKNGKTWRSRRYYLSGEWNITTKE